MSQNYWKKCRHRKLSLHNTLSNAGNGWDDMHCLAISFQGGPKPSHYYSCLGLFQQSYPTLPTFHSYYHKANKQNTDYNKICVFILSENSLSLPDYYPYHHSRKPSKEKFNKIQIDVPYPNIKLYIYQTGLLFFAFSNSKT